MQQEFWKDKRVFITGSAGFLGCWLSNNLADAGAKITGLDIEIKQGSNFHNFDLKNKINQLNVDITNYDLLTKTFKEHEPEIVFHLAAQPLVTEANKNPLPTFENNIRGTWNVLESARNSNINGIIVASSDKAYGIPEKLPYDENHKLHGVYPYDVSKSVKDLISQAYHKTFGLPVGITRCGNFFGGGDLYFDRIVPGTIKSFIFNESPIIRSDGKFIRDYIYIKDVVDAYTTLAENINKVKGHAFNFSTEIPLDVLTIVNKIASLMNSNIQPTILNQVKAEIREQHLTSKKAREMLGWQAKYDLDSALKETIEWYKEHFNGK